MWKVSLEEYTYITKEHIISSNFLDLENSNNVCTLFILKLFTYVIITFSQVTVSLRRLPPGTLRWLPFQTSESDLLEITSYIDLTARIDQCIFHY